ncbi:mitochondrial import inner membrane translocase subunit Tim21 isoform X2 [Calliopsis andreniformis]
MASLRVVNYISCRRLATVYNITNIHSLFYFNVMPSTQKYASYCTKKSVTQTNSTNSENKVQVGFAEVVKENVKSAGYLGVIIIGLGITFFMFYITFNELFSSKSSNGVYIKALNICKIHPKVIDALGQPIKAYGEENRRGRRNHINHIIFEKDGVRHMRMKFYIQGIRRRGTVNLEVQENESGDYVYTYLYVLVDDIMKTAIKIEDNRSESKIYSDDIEFELS